MTFPQFARIPVAQAQQARLLSWLNDCGWTGDDAYVTVSGIVQVRLVDTQDMKLFEHAMKVLNNGRAQSS